MDATPEWSEDGDKYAQEPARRKTRAVWELRTLSCKTRERRMHVAGNFYMSENEPVSRYTGYQNTE